MNHAKTLTPKSHGTLLLDDSLVIKGVAILLLFWHHCFLKGRFESWNLAIWPLTYDQVIHTASFSKICVSMFAFVSGYGLFLSYSKNNTTANRWVYNRFVKTFSGFWFVVIATWIAYLLTGRGLQSTYFKSGTVSGVFYMFTELLGLNDLFAAPTLLGTWWYMGAALIYLILCPLVYRIMTQDGWDVVSVIFIALLSKFITNTFPGQMAPLSFFPAFCLGMLFAKRNLFRAIEQIGSGAVWKQILKLLVCFGALYAAYKLYKEVSTETWWELKYGIIPLIMIIVIFLYVGRIPYLRTALRFIGVHSANIYVTHNVFKVLFFTKYVYGQKHVFAVIVFLLVISLAASILTEKIKSLLHYDGLIKKLFRV